MKPWNPALVGMSVGEDSSFLRFCLLCLREMAIPISPERKQTAGKSASYAEPKLNLGVPVSSPDPAAQRSRNQRETIWKGTKFGRWRDASRSPNTLDPMYSRSLPVL